MQTENIKNILGNDWKKTYENDYDVVFDKWVPDCKLLQMTVSKKTGQSWFLIC